LKKKKREGKGREEGRRVFEFAIQIQNQVKFENKSTET
jgi:hypothetical protein